MGTRPSPARAMARAGRARAAVINSRADVTSTILSTAALASAGAWLKMNCQASLYRYGDARAITAGDRGLLWFCFNPRVAAGRRVHSAASNGSNSSGHRLSCRKRRATVSSCGLVGKTRGTVTNARSRVIRIRRAATTGQGAGGRLCTTCSPSGSLKLFPMPVSRIFS